MQNNSYTFLNLRHLYSELYYYKKSGITCKYHLVYHYPLKSKLERLTWLRYSVKFWSLDIVRICLMANLDNLNLSGISFKTFKHRQVSCLVLISLTKNSLGALKTDFKEDMFAFNSGTALFWTSSIKRRTTWLSINIFLTKTISAVGWSIPSIKSMSLSLRMALFLANSSTNDFLKISKILLQVDLQLFKDTSAI